MKRDGILAALDTIALLLESKEIDDGLKSFAANVSFNRVWRTRLVMTRL